MKFKGPIFQHRLDLTPTRSFAKQAWDGIARGIATIDSTNSLNCLLPLTSPDLSALRKTFKILLERHPLLICHVEERNGNPWIIPPHGSALREPIFHTISDFSNAEDAQKKIGEFVWSSFSLNEGPLYRAGIICIDGSYKLLLVIHSFIADGISFDLIVEELLLIYRSILAGAHDFLPTVPMNFFDYLNGLNEWIASSDGEAARQHIIETLCAITPLQAVESKQRSDAASEILYLSGNIQGSLKSLAKRLKVTMFTLLLSAQNIVLKSYSSDGKVPVRIITSGRNSASIVRVIGKLSDSAIVLTDMSASENILDVILATHVAVQRATDYAFIKSDFVQEDVSSRVTSLNAPIFNFMPANTFSESFRQSDGSGLHVPPPVIDVPTRPRGIYYLKVFPKVDGMKCFISFGSGSIADFAYRYSSILEKMIADPNGLLKNEI